ncbi:MAG: tRNA pseudouridine(55) synthase TruB [Planctomycetales bacterium]|nr:tRNA pseudouridine(55) synthase TruB [Planctomycetales bacterium]
MNGRCGLLNIDKPVGVTSREVVDAVELLFPDVKCGHAGTLDPLASGVLVICVGAATRLIPFLQEHPKQYVAQFLLGRRSDTDDATGTVVETPGINPPTREQIESLLPQFTGEIDQVPPQFSAVRWRGLRAYDVARAGKTFVLPPRRVTVHAIDLLAYEWPRLELRIDSGSGVYVRSIGRDIGELLGCGALLGSLVRTRIGSLTIEDAIPLDRLDADSLDRAIVRASAATSHLPQYHCTETDQSALREGRRISITQPVPAADRGRVAIVNDAGDLVAVAEYFADEQRLAARLVIDRWAGCAVE